ncbi:MAG: right-handed parallel beta-helix repeat-containing protein [bacterium]|nr:right-handed parallel beta-helix repeat-containing protein [bacterium]
MHCRHRLLQLSVIVGLVVIGWVSALGSTNISGTISESTTWTVAGSPYILTGEVRVRSTTASYVAVLTIQSGVQVRFNSGAWLHIGGTSSTQRGGLVAKGVIFTSNSLFPAAGDWYTIYFDTYSEDTLCTLSNSGILYGTYGIYCNNAEPTLSVCTIGYMSENGVYGETKGYPTIKNCVFSNINDYPISIPAEGIRKISQCSFSSNTRQGIEARTDTIITSGTWSNHGVPYVINGAVSVYTSGSGCVLNLPSGVILKFASSGSELRIAGSSSTQIGGLIATGVHFTSLKDDSIGGDTYGDGTATTPAVGDWRRIRFDQYTISSSALTRCVVRYAGATYSNAIYIDGGAPTFSYCTVSSNNGYGIYAVDQGYPTISSCNISYNSDFPISVEAEGIRKISNCTLTNNMRQGIQVRADTVITSGTWTNQGVPYVISGVVQVYKPSPGCMLTLESGCIIKFDYREYSRLQIAGSGGTQWGGLNATGVIFTSMKDDSVGGDTFGDGTTTTPAPGDWYNISFDEYSIAGTGLTNCVVRYAGSSNNPAIFVNSTYPTFTACTIIDNADIGIWGSTYGYPTITNCRFENNGDYPISLYAEGVRNITGCTFTNNKRQGVEVRGGTVSTSCTWMNQGIPYVISGDVNVYAPSPGCMLTIASGNIIKFGGTYTELQIGGSSTTQWGGLIATGVTFTSIKDDSVGGDTYGDGTVTSPAPGDWEYIYFATYTISSTNLDRCKIRYGANSFNGAIYVYNSSPTFSYCTVEYSKNCGIYGIGQGYPSITNCRFENNQDYPISLEAEGIRKVTGCNFNNNNRQGIQVRSDIVITSCTWTNQGVPYVLNGDVNVYAPSPGCMLTIASGNIIKFDGTYTELQIGGSSTTQWGGLMAIGVIFTSVKDDSVGGDTNGDGIITYPSAGDWFNLYISEYMISSTKLERCIIRYGGYSSNAMIYADSCSPTFSFCTIGYSKNFGIYGSPQGYPTISTCVFEYNQDYPISVQAEGVRKITGCSFSNNTPQGIQVRYDIVRTTCTWTNQGVPYVIEDDVSVYTTGSGCILTLSPGVVLKFAHIYAQLNIAGSSTTQKGGLIATGVTFTSIKDDSVGGDTYGDGTATSPSPGDWECIYFERYTLATTRLDQCIIRYGGYSYNGVVYVNGSNPTFSYCTVEYSKQCGIYGLNDGYPTVSNCRFTNNQEYPISLEAEGIRKVTGCSFSNNKRQGIEARYDIVQTSGTWTNQGVPYVINGTVSIHTTGGGCILTLNPGVIIKFADYDSELDAGDPFSDQYGGLIAVGNVYAPIYFTSIKDDSIGGDTYGDGTATSPAPGDWSRIYLGYYTLPSSVFDHCIIRYARYGIDNAYAQDNLKVRYCLIEKNAYCGIYAYGPINGELRHNTIINNLGKGIEIQDNASQTIIANNNICQNAIGIYANNPYALIFQNNNISKNTTYGAQNSVTTRTVNGEFNWWGDTTGPYDGSTIGLYNPFGKGDTVSNYIDYDPWLRENPEQPRRLPDIKLLKGYEQDEVFDLDRYILDTAASFTWETNPDIDQARIVINPDNTVDYTLTRTTAFVGIDSVSYCANWYAKSTSLVKYSTYLFERLGDAIIDNGNEVEHCWLDLRAVIIKDASSSYPTIYKSTTKYDDPADNGKITVTLSGSTAEIVSSTALKSPVSVIFTVQKDTTGTDYDKALLRVYEIVNQNGHFDVAGDTTKWIFEVYGDGSGSGTLSWVTGYTDGSGVVKINQNPGQKGKLTQVFTVPKSGWYTARARIVTDVTSSSKQQKVYLYLQELNASNQVVEVANQVLSNSAGAFAGAGIWREVEINYYAKGTSLAVQLVAINPASSGITANLYVDYIWVYPAPPLVTRCFGATQVDILNPSFDTTTSGWSLEVYGDGSGTGTWSWDTGLAGMSGILKGSQSGGEKAKWSQLYRFSNPGLSATGSVWIYSGAGSIENSQKIYLYLYSWNSSYTKIIESGNAILQPGRWTPGQWRELKFGYTPLTNYNAVQLVAINPSGKPTATIYFDDVKIEQDQDTVYYWDHRLF